MAFCDYCGDVLEEHEEERELDSKVCDRCLHRGLKLLGRNLGRKGE